MRRQHIYMESTTIDAAKTVAEIEHVLASHGADRVLKEYTAGEVESVSFVMLLNGQPAPFRLPFRWREIQALAKSGRTGSNKTAEEGQARRVAARLVLRWVQAQMELVRCGMVRPAEVFLPYLVVDGKRTLFEISSDDGGLRRLLGPARE